MKLITLFSLVIIFFSCKSSKFENNTPFNIEKAIYQNWVGGQPGAKGIRFEFILNKINDGIVFQTLYFDNKTEKLYLRKAENNTVLSANINTANNSTNNIILHKDPKKEYGNTLPIQTTFPFKLKEHECVISYLQNGKEKFYKLLLVKEKDVFYP